MLTYKVSAVPVEPIRLNNTSYINTNSDYANELLTNSPTNSQ